MPLLATEHIPIPTKDIISWCYDNREAFDQDKPIYVDAADPSRSISATQAYKLIRQLVAGFQAAGLKKGDVVCLHSFNNLYYPILVQGIVAAGGAFVGTNPSYTPFELAHALKTSKARFVIAEPEILSAPKTAALELGMPKERILLLAAPEECEGYEHASWMSLLEHGEQDWVRFDDEQTAKDTAAFLMFSSGTTGSSRVLSSSIDQALIHLPGLPKAAVQSHYNLIAEHTLVHENPKHKEPYHMSRVVCLPMFHTAIAPFVHITTLRSGRESYIMKRFALREYLEYMKRFQITNALLVPPMIIAVVNAAAASPEQEKWVRECLSSVVHAVGGGAPVDREIQARLQTLLPPESVVTQVWAMTETTCVASAFYYPESDSTGSTGRFMPNLDVKIVDPDTDSDGPEVGPYDVRGELCIRGPTVIKGYLDNPEANARDWDEEGFFHTGDIVYCDSKTKLWYVVDRRKELIKVRGFQVAPSEIEGVLLSHPLVKDAAVIGVVRGEAGELPRAYVVVEAGKTLTEEEVRSWVGEKLARYKQVEGGVKFVESIPKTVSGKILKRVLKEEAKRELSASL
ncbi:uncharacterized protein LTR77_004067 [Saxophila tyrrhenica]|uniref:Acetyl-CoA synthetase-like protein n=1 Tax=Saxophila tyrrhenica TaxID=1690608 RepID=A0AAV9PFX8_9PEZI|nr:hypothetical protein LTR77_004067 [Saxophila tyrrhenica]